MDSDPKKKTDRVLTCQEAEEFFKICDAEDAKELAEYVERLEELLKVQHLYIKELEEKIGAQGWQGLDD